MKKITFIAFLLVPAISFGAMPVQQAAPDYSWVDGKISFREGYVPSALETLIANSGIKFKNFSDFLNSVTSKDALSDKILDMEPSKAKQFQAAVDELKVENAKR